MQKIEGQRSVRTFQKWGTSAQSCLHCLLHMTSQLHYPSPTPLLDRIDNARPSCTPSITIAVCLHQAPPVWPHSTFTLCSGNEGVSCLSKTHKHSYVSNSATSQTLNLQHQDLSLGNHAFQMLVGVAWIGIRESGSKLVVLRWTSATTSKSSYFISPHPTPASETKATSPPDTYTPRVMLWLIQKMIMTPSWSTPKNWLRLHCHLRTFLLFLCRAMTYIGELVRY